MATLERYLRPQIESDLKKKISMVSGPRQCGKTTLAKSLMSSDECYLNWDVDEHRSRILRKELPDQNLWVFDELHKYDQWTNYLKGLFDIRHPEQKILVTGSARLEVYHRGGDSLQGRYHLLRLHPFSFRELNLRTGEELQELLTLGGFPEPWLSSSEIEARRWSNSYCMQFGDDIRSLESVQYLGQLQKTMLLLPERVGSTLSINALREELRVSHGTMSLWLDVLERLFYIFRIPPVELSVAKTIRKAQKHYHFDWTLMRNQATRFENLIAAHLLKWVHYMVDVYGHSYELKFYRDRYDREVDFVITDRAEPILAVECKLHESKIGYGLKYLARKYPYAKMWQIHEMGSSDYVTPTGIRVAPAIKLLRELV